MPPFSPITGKGGGKRWSPTLFPLLFALSAQWHKEVSIVSFYCSTVVSALGSHSGSECAAAQSDPFAIKELASGVDLFCISDRACVPGSVIVELLAQGVF